LLPVHSHVVGAFNRILLQLDTGAAIVLYLPRETGAAVVSGDRLTDHCAAGKNGQHEMAKKEYLAPVKVRSIMLSHNVRL